MSVDYYSCSRCGSTYCDCSYYATCNEDTGGCGRNWCDDDCAEKDGYIECSCKLGKNIEDGCCYDCGKTDKYNCCHECENYVGASCNYCRKEEYEDAELLFTAMKLLKCDRKYLIDKRREDKIVWN